MRELGVTTITGADTVLERAVLENFKASIRGELLRPSDDGYDAARKVYNAMIDKRPALIVRYTGTQSSSGCAGGGRNFGMEPRNE
jgi:hypothetical protein